MTPTTKAGRALLENLRVWTTVSPHWEGPEDEVWGYVVLDLTRVEQEARADEAEALRAALRDVAAVAHSPSMAWRSTLVSRMHRIEDIAIAALAAPVAASERCGFPEGCQAEATCELSINGTTWHLCDDHAVRVLEAFAPAAPAEDAG